ncbi:MAG TPA: hypothetical protein PLX68_09870 [Dermatophilaceae bacterium]|nr:hypothetical protein [Dermatophilaceae bacterium]
MSGSEPHDEDLRTRANRILRAVGDTQIPAMDAIFYAHYAEELRLIVEELHADPPSRPGSAARVWLVWNCDELVGCFVSEHDAREARTDQQHQLLCEYGPDAELLESITISAAHVPTGGRGMRWSDR